MPLFHWVVKNYEAPFNNTHRVQKVIFCHVIALYSLHFLITAIKHDTKKRHEDSHRNEYGAHIDINRVHRKKGLSEWSVTETRGNWVHPCHSRSSSSVVYGLEWRHGTGRSLLNELKEKWNVLRVSTKVGKKLVKTTHNKMSPHCEHNNKKSFAIVWHEAFRQFWAALMQPTFNG